MAETQIGNLDAVKMASIISQSGCSDIQNAIASLQDAGFQIVDLDSATLEAVVSTIASAESVGAQAGRR